MRIGIDFDNTLANYDGVFHRVAVADGLVPVHLPRDKTSVRDYLRAKGRDSDFTLLQGHVYGTRMDLVALYPGADRVVRTLAAAGHALAIISHKTKIPFAGPPHDLHAAARGFLDRVGLVAPQGPVAADSVFFELTKEAKVARAAALDCDVFIDDLPEILALAGFPAGLRAILFDPDGHYPGGRWQGHTLERHATWDAIGTALAGESG